MKAAKASKVTGRRLVRVARDAGRGLARGDSRRVLVVDDVAVRVRGEGVDRRDGGGGGGACAAFGRLPVAVVPFEPKEPECARAAVMGSESRFFIFDVSSLGPDEDDVR